MNFVKIPEVLFAYHRNRRPGDTPRLVLAYVYDTKTEEHKVAFSQAPNAPTYPVSQYLFFAKDGSPFFFPTLSLKVAVANSTTVDIVNNISSILKNSHDELLVQYLRWPKMHFELTQESFKLILALVKTAKAETAKVEGVFDKATGTMHFVNEALNLSLTVNVVEKAPNTSIHPWPTKELLIGETKFVLSDNENFTMDLLNIAAAISNQLTQQPVEEPNPTQDTMELLISMIDKPFELTFQILNLFEASLRHQFPEQMRNMALTYGSQGDRLELHLLPGGEIIKEIALKSEPLETGIGKMLTIGADKYRLEHNRDLVASFGPIVQAVASAFSFTTNTEQTTSDFQNTSVQVDHQLDINEQPQKENNMTCELESFSPHKLTALLSKFKLVNQEAYYRLSSLAKEPQEENHSGHNTLHFIEMILRHDYGRELRAMDFVYEHEHILYRNFEGEVKHDTYLKITHHDDGTHFVFSAHRFVIKTNGDLINKLQDITDILAAYLCLGQKTPEEDVSVATMAPKTVFKDAYNVLEAEMKHQTKSILDYLASLGLEASSQEPEEIRMCCVEGHVSIEYVQRLEVTVSARSVYILLTFKHSDQGAQFSVSTKTFDMTDTGTMLLAELLANMPAIK